MSAKLAEITDNNNQARSNFQHFNPRPVGISRNWENGLKPAKTKHFSKLTGGYKNS